MASKKSADLKKQLNVFVALPSKLLEDGEGPVDEYIAFVKFLERLGCNVICPLREVNWSTRKPQDPHVTLNKRLKDLAMCDRVIALPIVGGHKSSGVMGYIFYAAAKEIPVTVYLRGSTDLDVPWQIVGLRDCGKAQVCFYRSNLLDGFPAVEESVVGHRPVSAKLVEPIDVDPCPYGPTYQRYWNVRTTLFSKWDSGIETDDVGLCSLKPEEIACGIAKQLLGRVVFDAFGGIGGSAIAFARAGKKVISCEVDPDRLRMAKVNASVYGVESEIEFVGGNAFQTWKKVKDRVDAVYLDPSWGGPLYQRLKSFRFEDFEVEGNGSIVELIADAYRSHKSIAISMPRNFDTRQLSDLHGRLLNLDAGGKSRPSTLRTDWHTRDTKVLFMTGFLNRGTLDEVAKEKH